MNSEYRELLESLDPWIWMPGQPHPNVGMTAITGNQPYSAGQHPSVLFDQGFGRIYSGASSVIPGEKGYLHPLSNLRHINISGLEDLTGGFTCVAVVNPMEIVNWSRIISFGRTFINSEVIFSRNGMTNDLHLGWWNGQISHPPLVTTGNRMPLNKEVLVVGMYDPVEGKTKLFIDGERVAEMATTPPASDPDRKIVSFGGHCQNGEQWVGTITMPAIFLRALTDAEVMELARKSTIRPITHSGRVPLTPSAIGGVASVIGTASVGGGKVFQAEVGPDGSWESTSQDIAVDISFAGKLAAGHGLLSGSFPLSMLTNDGNLPSQSEIRILYRPNTGDPGDGYVVATTTCNADGTWQVSGLDEDLKFDIVARIPGFNDVIISDVQPVTGAPLSAHFANLKEEYEYGEEINIQVVALGGRPPYTYEAITLPDGLSLSSDGYITGTMFGVLELTFEVKITDVGETVFNLVGDSYVAGDPHWDKVAALLHFDDLDNPWKDETGRTWSTFGDAGSFVLVPGAGIDGKAAVVLNAPAGSTQRCIRSPGVIPTGALFTIEAFVKPSNTNATLPIASQPVSSGNGDQVFRLIPDPRVLSYYKGSTSALVGPAIDAKGLDLVSVDSFSHIVLQFDGQNIEAYLNGVIQFSVSRPEGWIDTANQFQIGNTAVPGYQSYSGATAGIIDSMRVTVGVARYSENFTPPSAPFPNFGPPKEYPTIIGEPWGGGFYAGDIESDGQWYKLIVADVSAEVNGLRWKTTNSSTADAVHLTDGVVNTNAMIAAGIELHPAANHCVNYNGGGYLDWYMPAKDELNVLYQNLGPRLPDCPPDFQTGGSQAFSEDSNGYWASTQSASSYGWYQRFSTGSQTDSSKTATTRRVRPVRRLQFNP